jgi:ABC-2 type transport system permease protein
MAVLSLFVSMLIFGTSDLMVFKSEEFIILDRNDVLWRYVYAFGFAAVSMLTVASMAFLLSIFAENSIGPIVTTMSIIIVLTILTTMNIPFFNGLKPFLFTNHMLNWKGFFDDEIDYKEIGKSTMVLFTHIVLFIGAAIFIFRKKDILS